MYVNKRVQLAQRGIALLFISYYIKNDFLCVCVYVRACVRECVRACVCVCVLETCQSNLATNNPTRGCDNCMYLLQQRLCPLKLQGKSLQHPSPTTRITA